MDVDDLLTTANSLLAAVVAGWPAEAEPLPGRSYVNDGQVPWDCEQLTVNVERLFATEGDLGVEAVGVTSGLGLFLRAGVFAISLVRCSPVSTQQGQTVKPPTIDKIEASASRVLRDAEAVFGALAAELPLGNYPGCGTLAFESWTAEGPEGGFAGGTTRVRVLLT